MGTKEDAKKDKEVCKSLATKKLLKPIGDCRTSIKEALLSLKY